MRAPIMGVGLLLAGMAYLMRTVDNPPSETPPSRPGKVYVALLGPVSEVEGIDAPADVLAGRSRFFPVKGPSIITVTLPGDKEVSLPVKTAIINTRSGVVVDVDLLPLAQTVSYKEAINKLHGCIEFLGVKPDEQMKEKMATWPEDASGFEPGFYPHTYRAGMFLSEDASLFVKVRPAADGGWFLVLTFEAIGPARRALWDPTVQDAAEPSEGEAEEEGEGNGT